MADSDYIPSASDPTYLKLINTQEQLHIKPFISEPAVEQFYIAKQV